ncbi:MAG: class I SAM-dependent methyltransferase [Deltaproteobacteria bacterium]|nr:class I SAM-dependent methyltransferase [Deltaproteobacteria bacterium]
MKKPSVSAHRLDAAIEAGLARFAMLQLGRLVPTPLARARTVTAAKVASRFVEETTPLAERVAAHNPRAIADFDALVAEAIREARDVSTDGPLALLAALDRRLYENGDELLDDPAFSMAERVHTLDKLDRFNAHLGSYAKWGALVETLVVSAEQAGHAPVRVVDLAAGHGGFAIALKQRLGRRIAITATDTADEYLELGRSRARASGADIAFAVQDATNLTNFAEGDVDVFLCTQSLHHFPPGMVARLFAEAARRATTGVSFIDGERGWVPLVTAVLLMTAYGRTWPLIHDTYVSLRRMYTLEELRLIGALAPAVPDRISIATGTLRPGFIYLQATIS